MSQENAMILSPLECLSDDFNGSIPENITYLNQIIFFSENSSCPAMFFMVIYEVST